MKKIIVFTLLILLSGFITNTATTKTDLRTNLNSPLPQRTKAMDLKTGVVAPDKTNTLNREAIITKAASLAVPFVQNCGQFHGDVRFSADLFAGRFFLTGKELVYSLRQRGKAKITHPDKPKRDTKLKKNLPGKGLAFREFFVDRKGAKINFKSAGEQKAETVVSYFKGNDPSKWRSGIASYQSISLGEVYPGIEVKLKASDKNVEKIFYVSPQSDVADIKIGVAGVAGLEIDKDGRLLFKNSLGNLAMRAPVAWQEIAGRRDEVKVIYRLLGDYFYGFTVLGAYDKKYPLIIDPDLDTLLSSTFLGGAENDEGQSIALDKWGNVYLAGITRSFNFPTTGSAYDRTFNGDYYEDYGDVVLSKLDSNLTTLLASTYLGGKDFDIAQSLALDDKGNVYVSGQTSSSNFPTTASAYQQNFNVRIDVFISKLDGNLSKLLASSFLGGGNIGGRSLALDGSGNVYLAAYGGGATVSKLDSGLTTLFSSIVIGGGGQEDSTSLALDSSGNVYVCGFTTSSDFPTTPGAYDRSFNGERDIFVTKLDGNLATFLASTYLGGSATEWNCSLALDRSGNVYVTGDTHSFNFPTTPGAYARTHNGDYTDAFVSKLNGQLTTLLASTFLGGSKGDYGRALAMDSAGNVYVTGSAGASDFPTTPEAYTRTYHGGNCDAFVAKLDSRLTTILASTFLGGSDFDSGYSLALDIFGNVYLTGGTSSTNFPTTPGAFDRTYGGDSQSDIFVSKFNGGMNSLTVTSPNGGENWVVGTSHDITWARSGKITAVRIEFSIDNGSVWSDVIAATNNGDSYPWIIPSTPSFQCLIRISDAAAAAMGDTGNAVFSIIMSLDLQADRREVRSFSVVRQYGQIRFLGGNLNVPAAQYRILRRQGIGNDFMMLRTIAPSELQNNQFQMQDKFLEKDTPYSYRVEAYDAAERLIALSEEKTI
jgi:hypothetical protein